MIDTTNIAKWKLEQSKNCLREIQHQPKKWVETFEIIKKLKNELNDFLTPEYDVVFTGSGTSDDPYVLEVDNG